MKDNMIGPDSEKGEPVDSSLPPSPKKTGFMKYIWPVILTAYLFIASLVFNYICLLSFPRAVEFSDYYANYPPPGSEWVVMAGALFLTGFIIAVNILYVRKMSGWKKALVNIFLVLFFFGALEFSLREFIRSHPVKTRPNPYTIWELNPAGCPMDETFNSYNMRSAEFPVEKEKNEFRFIVVGDSSAYGASVADEERFSSILEKRLQAKYPDKKVRVINSAYEGYTSFQARRLFDLRLRDLQPDCLIISFNNDTSFEKIPDKRRVPADALLPIFSRLYKSELFLFLRKFSYILKNKLGGVEKNKLGEKQINRVPLEDAEDNYSCLIKDVRKAGGSALVISMPMRSDSVGNSSVNVKYRELLDEISAKRGALFADIYHQWRKDGDNDKLFLENDTVHPNKEGHHRIAGFLYDLIVENGMVGK